MRVSHKHACHGRVPHGGVPHRPATHGWYLHLIGVYLMGVYLSDGGRILMWLLNLWRMELFKYMKVCQAAVARCRHHTVATRRL